MASGGMIHGSFSNCLSSSSGVADGGGSGVLSWIMLDWVGKIGTQWEQGGLAARNVLAEQFGVLSTRNMAGVVEAGAGIAAACSFGVEFGGEGVVEFTASHSLFVLG